MKIIFNENNLRNLAISEFKNLFLSSVMKSSNAYFRHKPVKIELSSKVGIRSQMFDKNSKKLFHFKDLSATAKKKAKGKKK